LEAFGLSLQAINALENGLGVLYVSELRGVTEVDLLELEGFGPAKLRSLRAALRNFIEGKVVKSKAECLRFTEGK
jgi:hypothetical protein